METFNAAQYEDLQAKSQDLYAQTKYDILLDYLQGHSNLRILNAGCGSGELSIRLAAAGHRVEGIDPEPAYIELARLNAAQASVKGCRFSVSFIESYHGPSDFDCVIATDVLEHIKDDRTAFGKLISHVKPGGIVLITVPAGQWLFGYHDEQLGHFRRYCRSTLQTLVRSECDVNALRYFGFSLSPVGLVFSKLLRRPYPVAESGDKKKRPIQEWILRSLLQIDRRLPVPFGTSLLFKGIRKISTRKEFSRAA